jgi:gas vesicle protein
MEQETNYKKLNLLIAFLSGSLIGVGIALLLAPYSGRETREKIKGFKDDAFDNVETYAQETKNKITSKVEKGKEFLEEKKSAASEAVKAGKEALKIEKEIV